MRLDRDSNLFHLSTCSRRWKTINLKKRNSWTTNFNSLIPLHFISSIRSIVVTLNAHESYIGGSSFSQGGPQQTLGEWNTVALSQVLVAVNRWIVCNKLDLIAMFLCHFNSPPPTHNTVTLWTSPAVRSRCPPSTSLSSLRRTNTKRNRTATAQSHRSPGNAT